MRLINLIENTEGCPGCAWEHGLSFYMETAHHCLLLDFGASEKIIENAEVLGIDLAKVDTAILSHGHYDHSGGLLAFARQNQQAAIYIQKSAMEPYYHLHETYEKYIGVDRRIGRLPQIHWLCGNFVLDETIELFTHISGRKYFAKGNLALKRRTADGDVQDDFSHEQCAVIREGQQTVLFSGCAHNGILNIMDEYFRLYQSYPTLCVSGFHMMQKQPYSPEAAETIRETARALVKTGTQFYTGHCTGQAAYAIMKEIMGEQLQPLHSGCEILY